MLEGNWAVYEGFLPYVPKVRETSTTCVCKFALKNTHELDGVKQKTGASCVAWGPVAKEVVQAKTSDLVRVEGMLSKQKIWPEILDRKGFPIYEMVLNVKECTINGKTLKAVRTAPGEDIALPFDL